MAKVAIPFDLVEDTVNPDFGYWSTDADSECPSIGVYDKDLLNWIEFAHTTSLNLVISNEEQPNSWESIVNGDKIVIVGRGDNSEMNILTTLELPLGRTEEKVTGHTWAYFEKR